ncbi:MAG: hypothetical protein LBC79_00220 [Deltaproteobacteria bacterium]|jgi:hypothetical protein|nr:hypothetical protein [Deltaproteobacteria bacterium]
MVIVDLQELEERARLAAESIGGVVMEPEALLLVISEIRRMKSQLGEQNSYLTDMLGELLKLRTELMDALVRGQTSRAAPAKKKGKMLKMKVIAKD